MTQVFGNVPPAGYCVKCHQGYAVGPHVCPTDEGLWCVHILGPDDLYAAPSKAEAERAVAYMTDYWQRRFPEEAAEGLVKFEAAPWPHSAESHARDVGKFYRETGLSENGSDERRT